MNMNKKDFEREYLKFLKGRADKKRVVKEKAYLYSDLQHFGVPVWERRKFIGKYKKELADLSKTEAL